jgi:serine/threonine protein kinase
MLSLGLCIDHQVLLESRYGRKADIWSVGGAVLQMLTGDPPWKELNFNSAVALMYHISHTESPPPMPDDLKVRTLMTVVVATDDITDSYPCIADQVSYV